MRALRILALIWLTSWLLPIESASAEPHYSGTLHAGYALTRGNGLGMSGRAGVARAIDPHWSVGAEAAYSVLPALNDEGYIDVVVPRFDGAGGTFLVARSASGLVELRDSNSLARPYIVGTAGYCELTIRTRFNSSRVAEDVARERHAEFSLGAGVSGPGHVMPGFQLRWSHLSGMDRSDIASDALSFEFGLHFE
jgi:hypothetical protein